MGLTEAKTRRVTVDEYYRMADMGMFEGRRVELIDGEIVEMAPQRDRHAAALSLTGKALSKVFGEGYWVRSQIPLDFGQGMQPEPDIAVVKGTERDFIGTGHPRSALLIVEVSDTTLRTDRTRKASLYASRGIADYWIVNIEESQVEVYRDPVVDEVAPFGVRYQAVTILRKGQAASPLAMPQGQVAVADMLP